MHADPGEHITVAFLTSGEWGLQHLPRVEAWQTREAEANRACKILGIHSVHFFHGPDQHLTNDSQTSVARLAPLLRESKPELIYLPHPQDAHPDYKASLPVPRLLAYEIWSPMPAFSHVEDVTVVMTRKLRAIRTHHSQVAQIVYDRAIQGLNRYRGIIAGQGRYAEVFQELHL